MPVSVTPTWSGYGKGRDRERDSGALHGESNIVKVIAVQQVDVTLRGLDERLGGRVAVLLQKPLFQTAAVDADADRDPAGLAGLGDLAHVLLIADVAGVDADFMDARLRRGEGEPIVEMNVRDDRDRRRLDDLRQSLGGLPVRDGETDDLAAGGIEALDLVDGRLRVGGAGVAHRLHRDGSAAADEHAADVDLLGICMFHLCSPEKS